MRIKSVEAVYPKWKNLPSGVWQSRFWQMVVRVESDTGEVGLGYGGGGEPACLIINRHFRDLVVGRTIESPQDIRAAWDHVYALSLPYGRKGIQVMALSGLDLALWDLLGKRRGRPVYDLLREAAPAATTKERVRAYASGEDYERYRDMGYTAVKFPPGDAESRSDVAATAATARRARGVMGEDALLMTDCYMAWDYDTTVRMAGALREFDLYWIEDALTPDHMEEQAALRKEISPIKLAGGEHEFTRFGFESLGKEGALDIWQPDVTWCGGVTETLRILDAAEKWGVPVVPHRGGEVWGLHVIASTNCDDLAETHPSRWEDDADELWLDEPKVRDGALSLTDRPGFGVTLNEALL